MPLVCRQKPNRTTPRLFGTRDLTRIACAIFENGLATPDQIRDAIEECLPEKLEEECEEERSLIEVLAPLLFAGIATLAMLLPVVRALNIVRRGIALLERFVGFIISRVPWLRRLFPSFNPAGGVGTSAGVDAFGAAAAELTPQYIAALATTTRILAKLGKRLETTGPALFFLALAGITVGELTPPTEDS